MPLRLAVLLPLLACLAAAAAPVSAASAASAGEYIVVFDRGTTAAERADARRDAGARARRGLIGGAQVVTTADPGALRAEPDVAYVERNASLVTESVPNDPRYSEQRSLEIIGAPAAWDLSVGAPDVVVAVIDDGVAFDHPDLAANAWRNPREAANGVDDDGNGIVDDLHGADLRRRTGDPSPAGSHGTHVAGVIAAQADNGVGISGVAPATRLMGLRVDDADGLDTAAVVDAIDYAGRNGAEIVNGSFSAATASRAIHEAIARWPGMLFVFAAGNQSSGLPRYPCALDAPNVVCVGATTATDGYATFSNFGPHVDLAAPGTSVLSTVPATSEVFVDSFESDDLASRWRSTGWQRTNAIASDGAYSLMDSRDGFYPPNANTVLELEQGIELGAPRGCGLGFDYVLDLGEDGDALVVESSPDGETWTEADRFTEDAKVFAERASVPLPVMRTVWLRLRLVANGAGQGDGAVVDNLRLTCADGAYDGSEYASKQGTSTAAAHVAGAAAAALARRPGEAPVFLRNALLTTGDQLPALWDRVATKRRLNLARALTYEGRIAKPTTGPVSAVTSDSAVLSGSFGPHDANTSWHVEYGPTTAYGSFVQGHGPLRASDATVPFTVALPGLAPNATYQARVVAFDGPSRRLDGKNVGFTTSGPKPALTCRARRRPRSVSCTITRMLAGSRFNAKVSRSGRRVAYTSRRPASYTSRRFSMRIPKAARVGKHVVSVTVIPRAPSRPLRALATIARL